MGTNIDQECDKRTFSVLPCPDLTSLAWTIEDERLGGGKGHVTGEHNREYPKLIDLEQ